MQLHTLHVLACYYCTQVSNLSRTFPFAQFHLLAYILVTHFTVENFYVPSKFIGGNCGLLASLHTWVTYQDYVYNNWVGMERRKWQWRQHPILFNLRRIRKRCKFRHQLLSNSSHYSNHQNHYCRYHHHEPDHYSYPASLCSLWPRQWLSMYGGSLRNFLKQEVDFPFQVANSTAISIALPTLQKEMKMEPDQAQWVMSAYALSSVSGFILVRPAYGSHSPWINS